jgi:hypothetical protein
MLLEAKIEQIEAPYLVARYLLVSKVEKTTTSCNNDLWTVLRFDKHRCNILITIKLITQ